MHPRHFIISSENSVDSTNFQVQLMKPPGLGLYSLAYCYIPGTFGLWITEKNNLLAFREYTEDGTRQEGCAILKAGKYTSLAEVASMLEASLNNAHSSNPYNIFSVAVHDQKLHWSAKYRFTFCLPEGPNSRIHRACLAFFDLHPSDAPEARKKNHFSPCRAITHPLQEAYIHIEGLTSLIINGRDPSSFYIPLWGHKSGNPIITGERDFTQYARAKEGFGKDGIIRVRLLDGQGDPLNILNAPWRCILTQYEEGLIRLGVSPPKEEEKIEITTA